MKESYVEGSAADGTRRPREARWAPARSETPRAHGNASDGNWEIPRLSAAEAATDHIG
jgi:hypothetical protein